MRCAITATNIDISFKQLFLVLCMLSLVRRENQKIPTFKSRVDRLQKQHLQLRITSRWSHVYFIRMGCVRTVSVRRRASRLLYQNPFNYLPSRRPDQVLCRIDHVLLRIASAEISRARKRQLTPSKHVAVGVEAKTNQSYLKAGVSPMPRLLSPDNESCVLLYSCVRILYPQNPSIAAKSRLIRKL
jgi:hypothetical protein